MRVMVIPEDTPKDRYVVRPIVEAMMEFLGVRPIKVTVCGDRLRGVSEALKRDRLAQILNANKGMYDLFLLCVDRDGEVSRRTALDDAERFASSLLPVGRLFLAENAWQEIEVWLLAGHDLPSHWRWRDIRMEVDLKERYYLPFARERGLLDEPGEGRKALAQEAAHRYDRIRSLCSEDIAFVESRIRAWLAKPA